MSSIRRCFSECLVVGNSYTGGFAGGVTEGDEIIDAVLDCYFDHDVAPISDDYAAPKTTTEMKTQSTFSGWNFLSVWKLGAFAGGNRKSITGENGEYNLPVKDGLIDVFLELDPSGGYPFLQFETKKRITKSGRTKCDWYIRGGLPEF